jgi:hypothetical protein
MMETFPITKTTLILAGIIQALFAVWGDALNFYTAVLWAMVLFIFVCECVWTIEYFRDWHLRRKALVCLGIFGAFCAIGYVPLKNLYFKSDDDLKVSFGFGGQPQNSLSVQFVFRNSGKQTALVKALALLEIAALSQREDPNDFCDEVTPTELVTTQLAPSIMGPGAQVGADGLRKSLYYPKQVILDGAVADMKTPF